ALVSSVRPCRGGLSDARPPPGWETLPERPLTPFAFSGDQLTEPPGYAPHEYTDAWIYDPSACGVARSGIETPGTYDASSLRLREHSASGTFVVTGVRRDANAKAIDERTPFVAFQISRMPRLVFLTGRYRALGISLLV